MPNRVDDKPNAMRMVKECGLGTSICPTKKRAQIWGAKVIGGLSDLLPTARLQRVQLELSAKGNRPHLLRWREKMSLRVSVESWSVDLLGDQQLLVLTINGAAVELPVSTAEMIGRALQARAREAALPSDSTAANDQRKN